MVVLVRNPLSSELQCLMLPAEDWSVGDFLRSWCQAQELPQDHFYVKCNGRCINSEGILQDGALYSVEPRLCGGKGGFGSMLRALGAQIEKTTNREACRDLSGRRLRDVNHEKAMAEWVKQQAEREADKEQRRLERLKRKLVGPKHFFTNPDYQQQCHEMAERLEDSVLKGSTEVVKTLSCVALWDSWALRYFKCPMNKIFLDIEYLLYFSPFVFRLWPLVFSAFDYLPISVSSSCILKQFVQSGILHRYWILTDLCHEKQLLENSSSLNNIMEDCPLPIPQSCLHHAVS
uniref:Uncharacterized protein n=1 Tax=Micrurus carvalhoi TaxID=3147026 RepID=A0A2H6NI27_9SAUR